jgi:uncharacterized protein YndB with AHSA1/START domain
MPQTETEALVRELRITARPETIYPFLTDPSKMTQWMGRKVSLDPRPGGVYRVEINDRDTARGEFVELDPPARVVFTWGWEMESSKAPPGSSTVEISLEPDGDETILRLVHRGLPTAESVESHAHGWDHYMERLALVAAGRDPGPDPWATPPD